MRKLLGFVRWSKRIVGVYRLDYCVSYFYGRIRGRDVVDSTAEEKVLGCACAMQACGEQNESMKHLAIEAGLFLAFKFKLYVEGI